MRLRLGRARDFVYQVCHLSIYVDVSRSHPGSAYINWHVHRASSNRSVNIPLSGERLLRFQAPPLPTFAKASVASATRIHTSMHTTSVKNEQAWGKKRHWMWQDTPEIKCVWGGLQAIYLSVCLYLFYPIKHAVYCTLMYSWSKKCN